MRGNIHQDLTKKENWTFASEMTFSDAVDDKELDWFGVPFYGSFYPNMKTLIWEKNKRARFAPTGWLEANVVQIMDKHHYWYDPSGKSFHIFRV